MLQYLESQIGIAAHPSRRPRSLSSGAHSRDPLVTSSQDEVGDISAAGWAKRSVPTIQDRDHISGGHGARGAFAHPTIRSHALRMRSNSLKHNNLMLRSERRERLEAWAVSDSPISHSQYWSTLHGVVFAILCPGPAVHRRSRV